MSIVASGSVTVPLEHRGHERVAIADYRLEYGKQTRHYPGHEEIVFDGIAWEDTGEVISPETFSDYEHKLRERCMSNARTR